MQGAAGALLAFLTFVLRDQIAERHWHGGNVRERAVEGPPPSPVPAKVEVSCPESLVHPGVLEDVVRRVAAEKCVCEVSCECDSRSRDIGLVIAGGLTVRGCRILFSVFVYVARCRRPHRDGPRTSPSSAPRGRRGTSFGAGVIE